MYVLILMYSTFGSPKVDTEEHEFDCIKWLCLQHLKVYGGDIDEEAEEQFYLQRLEAGLFTLQLIDYIMLEICVSGPASVSTVCHTYHYIHLLCSHLSPALC